LSTHSIRTRIEHGIAGREPVAGTGAILLLAAWFGVIAGFLQLLPHALPNLMSRDPLEAASTSAFWLTPLAGCLFFAAGAVILALVLRVLRSRISVDVLVLVFGFVMWLTLATGLRIRNWAALILALGLAYQSMRVVRSRGHGFLRLVRRTMPALALLVAAILAFDRLAPAWRARAALRALPAASGSTNVVLLILDTVRADALSLYGYPRSTTPAIDAWAANGVVFDHAFAPSPWTLPSHASMFTGQWPSLLSADFHVPLDDEWPTVAEAFARHGYATTAIVANWTYGKKVAGLDRGFIHYDDESIDIVSLLASFRWSRRVLTSVRWKMGNHRSPQRRNAADITDSFLDWIDARPSRPFFAFLNYFDAHHPYEMPPSYETKYAATPPRYWQQNGTERNMSAERSQELRDAYDSALSFLDHEIGRLRDELERRDLLDSTLIIITADHGEHFGEAGVYTHANSLYTPLLHVPLVLIEPGRIPGGVRVEQPVSLRDMAATMIGVLPEPDSTFPGRTLLRFANGGDSLPGLLRAELRENDRAEPSDPIAKGAMHALVRGPYHYIRNGDGSVELYDYVSDPLESNDLAQLPSSAQLIAEFQSAADSIRNEQPDRHARN
jgi:arylsulfatase A-like enzyme